MRKVELEGFFFILFLSRFFNTRQNQMLVEDRRYEMLIKYFDSNIGSL